SEGERVLEEVVDDTQGGMKEGSGSTLGFGHGIGHGCRVRTGYRRSSAAINGKGGAGVRIQLAARGGQRQSVAKQWVGLRTARQGVRFPPGAPPSGTQIGREGNTNAAPAGDSKGSHAGAVGAGRGEIQVPAERVCSG